MTPHTPYLWSTLLCSLCFWGLSAQSLRRDTLPPIYLQDPANGIVLGEKVATFPGGKEAWENYLAQNLQYPKKALKTQKEGMVLVWFCIDTLGNITDAQALNDPGGGLAAEAVRLIKNGPQWIPAEQSGIKVTYRQIQPVVFKRSFSRETASANTSAPPR